jgi:hypothetical protein
MRTLPGRLNSRLNFALSAEAVLATIKIPKAIVMEHPHPPTPGIRLHVFFIDFFDFVWFETAVRRVRGTRTGNVSKLPNKSFRQISHDGGQRFTSCGKKIATCCMGREFDRGEPGRKGGRTAFSALA